MKIAIGSINDIYETFNVIIIKAKVLHLQTLVTLANIGYPV
jgi:hypothetical protein